ncbi:hypothetical protein C8R44DRAFT_884783 [Mycena epipterygia]|nr:hypothetical protein C8R44DRAFT_884783 [Mycena epipterygia]
MSLYSTSSSSLSPEPSTPVVSFDRDEIMKLMKPIATNKDTWTWDDEERWTTAPSQLQDFYTYWRNPTHIDFPHSLSLIPPGELPLNIHSPPVRKSTVPKAYKDIVENVYGIRQSYPYSGVVITGEPSVGKSTLVWYMLLQFITQDQPVILCQKENIYLFFRNTVYRPCRIEPFHFDYVPYNSHYRPMWALIDTDDGSDVVGGMIGSSCIFPVQFALPESEQYKELLKERYGSIFELPPWQWAEGLAE